jgi:hypothetical protein
MRTSFDPCSASLREADADLADLSGLADLAELAELPRELEADEARDAFSERALFALTRRFSWAIDSLSAGRDAELEREEREREAEELEAAGREAVFDGGSDAAGERVLYAILTPRSPGVFPG